VSIGIFRLLSALVLLLPLPKSAEIWSFLYMLSGLFSGLIALIWVKLSLGWGPMNTKLMNGKWKEGFYFSIGISAQGIYNDIDKTILTKITTGTVAGLYTAAYRIMDASFMPVSGLLSSTYPNFFKKGENGIKETSRYAKKLLPWTVGYGLLAMIGLIIFAPLLPLILGKGYTQTSAILLWISPIPLFRSFHYLAADSLTGSGYQKYRSIFQIAIAILNFLLNLWLIPTYGWLGAAWSSLISDGLLAVLLWGLTFFLLIFTKRSQILEKL
jgi:O-antigen/teichoic acid export membrane protein